MLTDKCKNGAGRDRAALKMPIVAAAAIRREKLTSQQVELVKIWLNPAVSASAAFAIWPSFRRKLPANLQPSVPPVTLYWARGTARHTNRKRTSEI